ncbi:MAG: hypothetical protein AAGF11_02205 [Myxococcota bacterium]
MLIRAWSLLIGTIGLFLVSWSCVRPAQQCVVHCLDYRVEPVEIADEISPYGFFDTTCANYYGGGMDAPLPVSAYIGRRCVFPQSRFDRIMAAIDAKNAMDLDSLAQEDADAYNNFVDELLDDLIIACKDHLTCNESYCDLVEDPAQPGPQVCTVSSALYLCDTYVKTVAETSLHLEHGSSTPGYAGTGTVLIIDPDENACQYIPFETGGMQGTSEVGSGVDTTEGEPTAST